MTRNQTQSEQTLDQQALALYESGLQQMWQGEFDAALLHLDRAKHLAESEEVTELITIRKAEALIALDRDGAEVSDLPRIVIRRRGPNPVYLAAYALMRKYSESADDRKRAVFYGEIARKAADELRDPLPRVRVLNGLGVIRVIESQFPAAIELFDQALAIIAGGEASDALAYMRAIVLGNLGGAKVLSGHAAEGIRMLETALPAMSDPYLVAEICLDLCFGHIECGEYEIAEAYGRRALDLAAIRRQVRNANHLLGEVCVRTDRYDEADAYFDVVAGFYPEFKNVKQLLVAVDLCSVVNWKA
jgi:tetratricopeptide (TPR) repeat protein